MMVSMFLTFSYNLVYTIWVAGFGIDTLAVLGSFMSIFLIIIVFGNNIGAGFNSLINRSIGAKDKKKVDNSVVHGYPINYYYFNFSSINSHLFLK